MQDRPSAAELLEAIRYFVETDLVPVLDGTKKFHARVAANLLSILQREASLEEDQLVREWHGLASLLGTDGPPPLDRAARQEVLRQQNETLCKRIREGDADDGAWRTAVLRHVRQTVMDKLAIANPKYSGAGNG